MNVHPAAIDRQRVHAGQAQRACSSRSPAASGAAGASAGFQVIRNDSSSDGHRSSRSIRSSPAPRRFPAPACSIALARWRRRCPGDRPAVAASDLPDRFQSLALLMVGITIAPIVLDDLFQKFQRRLGVAGFLAMFHRQGIQQETYRREFLQHLPEFSRLGCALILALISPPSTCSGLCCMCSDSATGRVGDPPADQIDPLAPARDPPPPPFHNRDWRFSAHTAASRCTGRSCWCARPPRACWSRNNARRSRRRMSAAGASSAGWSRCSRPGRSPRPRSRCRCFMSASPAASPAAAPWRRGSAPRRSPDRRCAMCSRTVWASLKIVVTLAGITSARYRSRSRLMSISTTLAPSPAATLAALVPTTPAAQHHHVRRRNARHAAEQNAAAHHRLFQIFRPLLDAHLPGDLAHRRQAAADGPCRSLIVSYAMATISALQARLRQLRRRREMKISEDDLPGPEQRDLRRLRLLDLDRPFPTGRRSPRHGRHDVRPRPCVILVRKSAGHARPRLRQKPDARL